MLDGDDYKKAKTWTHPYLDGEAEIDDNFAFQAAPGRGSAKSSTDNAFVLEGDGIFHEAVGRPKRRGDPEGPEVLRTIDLDCKLVRVYLSTSSSTLCLSITLIIDHQQGEKSFIGG